MDLFKELLKDKLTIAEVLNRLNEVGDESNEKLTDGDVRFLQFKQDEEGLRVESVQGILMLHPKLNRLTVGVVTETGDVENLVIIPLGSIAKLMMNDLEQRPDLAERVDESMFKQTGKRLDEVFEELRKKHD